MKSKRTKGKWTNQEDGGDNWSVQLWAGGGGGGTSNTADPADIKGIFKAQQGREVEGKEVLRKKKNILEN